LEKNQGSTPDSGAFNSFFLDYFGYMVWFWLLSQHRMALASAGELGHYDMPSSYTKFLVDSLTGLNVNDGLVNTFAVLFLTLALFASIVINVKDWRKKH